MNYYKATICGWETKAEAEEGDGDFTTDIIVAAKSRTEVEDLQDSPMFKQICQKFGYFDFFVMSDSIVELHNVVQL